MNNYNFLAMNLNDWRVWAKAFAVIVLLYGAFDFCKRGFDGVVHKRMKIYRWWAFFNEYSLDEGSDEKDLSGKRAVFIGSLYLLLGLVFLTATVAVAIFIPAIP